MDEKDKREKFSLPEKAPENYQSVLNVRNRDQRERDKLTPPQEQPDVIACCGKNCALCEYFVPEGASDENTGCHGCGTGTEENGLAETCDIRICCTEKGCKNCSECADFPCNMLRASALEDDDTESLVEMRSRTALSRENMKNEVIFVLCGLAVGVIVGAAFGIFAGSPAASAAGGAAVGAGIPLIILAGRNDS
ncbi:MAG: DUF3795 domain-containing protein [Oscillospiraceae bacterium]|nr:DUF3795 domain-containing protein [Oscillospiraceae bacterium]